MGLILMSCLFVEGLEALEQDAGDFVTESPVLSSPLPGRKGHRRSPCCTTRLFLQGGPGAVLPAGLGGLGGGWVCNMLGGGVGAWRGCVSVTGVLLNNSQVHM